MLANFCQALQNADIKLLEIASVPSLSLSTSATLSFRAATIIHTARK